MVLPVEVVVDVVGEVVTVLVADVLEVLDVMLARNRVVVVTELLVTEVLDVLDVVELTRTR